MISSTDAMDPESRLAIRSRENTYVEESVVISETISMADGYASRLYTWHSHTTPKAVIVGLHGINDYGMSFDLAANIWSRKQITTFAIDQRGYGCTAGRGRWHGEEKMLNDITTLMQCASERAPGVPIYLMGESMGASLALLYSTSASSAKPAGTILSSAPLLGEGLISSIVKRLVVFGAYAFPDVRVGSSIESSTATDNAEVIKKMSTDKYMIERTRLGTLRGVGGMLQKAGASVAQLKIPTLILFGEKDRQINLAYSKRIFGKFVENNKDQALLRLYQDGHHLLLRDLGRETPISDVADWVHNRSHTSLSRGTPIKPSGLNE